MAGGVKYGLIKYRVRDRSDRNGRNLLTGLELPEQGNTGFFRGSCGVHTGHIEESLSVAK